MEPDQESASHGDGMDEVSAPFFCTECGMMVDSATKHIEFAHKEDVEDLTEAQRTLAVLRLAEEYVRPNGGYRKAGMVESASPMGHAEMVSPGPKA